MSLHKNWSLGRFHGYGILLLVVLTGPVSTAISEDDAGWVFLQNEQLKIGIKKGSGGAIGWFSEAQSQENYVNHHDHGRLIQQSYYGERDGSSWAGKPWRWNPVQGGGYRGTPAEIIELKQQNDSLEVKTRPRHWATGDAIGDVLMEQQIRLVGPIAHIRFRMTYTGTINHPKHDQEIPAVFTSRKLETFVIGQSDGFRKLKPGFPNERYPMPMHWAAYVNQEDFGLGVCVPQADVLTCYRYGKLGQKGACSYFAPLAIFAISPEMTFEYDCYLSIGPLDQLQDRFAQLKIEKQD